MPRPLPHTIAVAATSPQVLVEAELPDGDTCSLLLQNAETVRLVCPLTSSGSSSGGHATGSGSGGGGGAAEAGLGWAAVSVSELAPGQQLLVLQQGAARHTGVAIEESITER
jgi:3-dehydroquinate synthase class II